ncbi:unnamed protein product [Rotaria sp. Silwood2]|nr:unnamed protein product [Rotaria sp. Silwood2]CAF4070329.1 unnamed protein product [Rotaria sp. Silwood2]CAF4305324.1 unnamed protein product [Rotaria sp. Silwood2]
MNFQYSVGVKIGSGDVINILKLNCDRCKRLRQLILGIMNFTKDLYVMKNHLKIYKDKIDLTLHNKRRFLFGSCTIK